MMRETGTAPRRGARRPSRCTCLPEVRLDRNGRLDCGSLLLGLVRAGRCHRHERRRAVGEGYVKRSETFTFRGTTLALMYPRPVIQSADGEGTILAALLGRPLLGPTLPLACRADVGRVALAIPEWMGRSQT